MGREALLAKASEPSLSVQTVTSLVRSAATRAAGGVAEGIGSGAEPRVDVERVERGDLERPGGRRLGALVHALLASIDLSADRLGRGQAKGINAGRNVSAQALAVIAGALAGAAFGEIHGHYLL